MSGDLDKTPAQIAAGIEMDRVILYRTYDRAVCGLIERGSSMLLKDKIALATKAVETGIELRNIGIIPDSQLDSAKAVLAGLRSEEAALTAATIPDMAHHS